MDHRWGMPFDTLYINAGPPYQNLPIRSYHSSDDSDSGSHGGGGLRPSGQMSGRDFIGHNRIHGPEDSPYFPPREPSHHFSPRSEPLHQFVSPASLHLPVDAQQYPGDRPGGPQYYRSHVEDQWGGHPGSPPPYNAEPFYNYPGPSMPTAMPPSAFQHSSSRYPDAGDYLRHQLNLPQGAVVNLWSVPEPAGGEKPSIPLPMLIKLAIYGSDKKRLTLQEIYLELIKRFQWFREHSQEQAWKNSIRHNLSLNKVFRSIQRPVTEPGKGSYWELDISGGEGYKRPRKRLGKKTNDEDSDGSCSDTDTGDAEYRGKGRRRSPYSSSQQQPRLRVNTDRSHDSSSPPTTGSGHGGHMPMIDPPAPQRRTMPSAYRQPAYGQGYGPIDPALHASPGSSAASSYGPPSQYERVLAHSGSATPVDSKPPRPEGRTLRPRLSLSSAGLPPSSSSSGAPLSPTDEAYAKSRCRAPGRS